VREVKLFVAFEVLTAVVMKSTIFWDVADYKRYIPEDIPFARTLSIGHP
jgi:hypothetical protein